MKKILGLLLMLGLMVSFVGCGGDKDSPTGPTGPQGQTLEIYNGEDGLGNKIEYQFYRNGNELIKHGYYKEYGETGNLLDEDTYREGSCVESCEWRKTYGDGSGSSVQQTVDGGFIVTGVDFENDGVFLLKTDGQGNEEWRKNFGDGRGNSVQQTVDGGFIVTGRDGDGDVFLLKTNNLGLI